VFNVPNQLTFLRLVLSVVLFVLISYGVWSLSLLVFAAAAVTDWLDGFLARKYGWGTTVGRNFDPLVDKVLICGAYICLLPIPAAGLEAWMVVVVVVRELVVTVVRSFLEGQGVKFGADWFGKLKMVLQCAALIAMLLYLLIESPGWLGLGRDVLLYAMVAATALSGLQYLWKFHRATSALK
jgi:CDP-diacylglycerol--glycerol-3-phosphate 3-phosphatidyltransferase